MPNPKKPRTGCLVCKKETARFGYKYCSNSCQQEYEYQSYIRKWLNGAVSGLQGLGIVSGYVKRYLRRKFSNKCCLCGWDKINSKIGYSPLVADHIDGNWRNNQEDNLRLICPNCDSLTSTYAGLNRGKGRGNRARSKRAQEGRLFLKSMAK
jgi:hypothetical protein